MGSLYYDLRTEDDELTFPTTLVLSEYKEEKYTEIQRNKWQLETINQKAWVLVDESGLSSYRDQFEEANPEIGFFDNSFYWQLKDSEPRTISTSYTANQPPAPERFTKVKEIYECPVKAKVYFPSFAGLYKDRIKELSVDSGLLTSKAQAQKLGKIEGLINWGKWKGNTCTTVLWDEFFDVSPLDPIDWTESTGLTHRFLIDGFSIAITGKRCAVSFDGIWVSKVDGSDIIPARDAMGLPSLIYLEGGDGDFGSVIVLPYSLAGAITITGGDSDFGSIEVIPPIITITGGDSDFGTISIDSLSLIEITGGDADFGTITASDEQILLIRKQSFAALMPDYQQLEIEKQSYQELLNPIDDTIIITGGDADFGTITASLQEVYEQLVIEKQDYLSLMPEYEQLTIEKQDYISLN
jgi:hypothetical protein